MKRFEDYLYREERKSFLRDEQWRRERDARRTREERKMRMYTYLVVSLFVVVAVLATMIAATVSVDSAESFETTPVEDFRLDLIVANADLDKPAEDPMNKAALFRTGGNVIMDCTITHYCCEAYAHICGTGDGKTATGTQVTAGRTCAVDPSVIPYGAEVMVDYGDSVAFYRAEDCGAWITGNHIDLAVETHAEAEEKGVMSATVYWMEDTWD